MSSCLNVLELLNRLSGPSLCNSQYLKQSIQTHPHLDFWRNRKEQDSTPTPLPPHTHTSPIPARPHWIQPMGLRLLTSETKPRVTQDSFLWSTSISCPWGLEWMGLQSASVQRVKALCWSWLIFAVLWLGAHYGMFFLFISSLFL